MSSISSMGRFRSRAAIIPSFRMLSPDRHRIVLIRLAADAADVGFVAELLDDVWVVQFESQPLRTDSVAPRFVDHHRLAVARAREDFHTNGSTSCRSACDRWC